MSTQRLKSEPIDRTSWGATIAARVRPFRRNMVRAVLALVLVGGLVQGVLLPATAQATHLCAVGLPVHFTPDPAASVWDVEGKITSFDRVNRTMTANGMTMSIPPTVLIKTNDLDQPVGNITFDFLTDPALEAVRTVIGGTAIAGGAAVFTAEVGGTCMSLVADSVFVELAENGLIGPLMSVDVAGGSFVVNGATIRMNTDPRFPSDLHDLGGNPITVADLVGNEGALMDVGGYFDPVAGVLFGTLVEAPILTVQPGKDTVAIERAQGRLGEMRVRGLVSRHPDTGLFVASVNVFAGTINAAGTGCDGSLLGPAAVDAVDGSFEFRLRQAGFVPPANVCVASPGGGVAERSLIQ